MRRMACIIFVVMMLIVGCSSAPSTNKDEPKAENVSMFMCVEKNGTWQILVDRKTRVMYAVSDGDYNRGIFTLLVDEEGKPLIYKEKE